MTSPGIRIGAVCAATLLAAMLVAGTSVPGRASPGPIVVHPPAADADEGGGAAAPNPSVEARRELLERRAQRIAAHRALVQRVRNALAGRGRSVAPQAPLQECLDEAEVQEVVLRLLREEIADLDRRTARHDLATTPREDGIDRATESRLLELERALDNRERDLADLERQLEQERRAESLLSRGDSPGSSIVPVPIPVPVAPSTMDSVGAPGPAGTSPGEALPDVRVIRESFLSSGLFSSQLILFETAKDRLLTISGPVLDAVAEVLREFPDARVRVEGHTDIRGGAEYNRRLSERRAAAVRNYLIETGRIDAARLTAVGLGFDRPLMDGTTPTAHALNRRVTLRILNPSALSAPVPIRN